MSDAQRYKVIGNGALDGDKPQHYYELGDVVRIVQVDDADNVVLADLADGESFEQWVSREHLEAL